MSGQTNYRILFLTKLNKRVSTRPSAAFYSLSLPVEWACFISLISLTEFSDNLKLGSRFNFNGLKKSAFAFKVKHALSE